MELKKLLPVAVAAAFALPFAAQASADSDRMILAQSGSSAVGTGPTGGVPSTQSAGEPKAPGDTKADLRRCEAMTGTERETCLRNAQAGTTSSGSSAATTGSATSGATSSPSTDAVVSPSGSGKTGVTAGPGESSPDTGPGSASATKPDTSGTGKP